MFTPKPQLRACLWAIVFCNERLCCDMNMFQLWKGSSVVAENEYVT